MQRKDIPVDQFSFTAETLRDQWLLLTAGEYAQGKYNSMTISWGSAGQIWDRMFFQVVVRPVRHTFSYMETCNYFTLCAFPARYKPALGLLGSKSGRDCDKIAESGLTPFPSVIVPTPGFEEAELIVECKKIYWHDIDPAHFLDSRIDGHYPQKDYHRAYFGEILHVSGVDCYRKKEHKV